MGVDDQRKKLGGVLVSCRGVEPVADIDETLPFLDRHEALDSKTDKVYMDRDHELINRFEPLAKLDRASGYLGLLFFLSALLNNLGSSIYLLSIRI